MAAIIKELLEDHRTAAPLTIHMNLLHEWFTLIQTDGCHDLMTGMLNFYHGGAMTYPRPSSECQLSTTLDNLILDLTGKRMEKILPFWGSL